MPTFALTLQRTYYKMGFFNVGVTYDRHVRRTEGPVRIRLGHDGPEIEGRVDRHANQNGTARVMGGVQLKRWFQANFDRCGRQAGRSRFMTITSRKTRRMSIFFLR
jgi:hypothetical protein